MNKKLVLAAALVFGVAGLILANTVGAYDATDNSTTTTTTTVDNSSVNTDNAVMNAENPPAPVVNAAQ